MEEAEVWVRGKGGWSSACHDGAQAGAGVASD